MPLNLRTSSRCSGLAALSLVAAAFCATGCQYQVGGQTLPSAFYLQDDVQYFPAGPEFQLSNEAASMQLLNAEAGG